MSTYPNDGKIFTSHHKSLFFSIISFYNCQRTDVSSRWHVFDLKPVALGIFIWKNIFIKSLQLSLCKLKEWLLGFNMICLWYLHTGPVKSSRDPQICDTPSWIYNTLPESRILPNLWYWPPHTHTHFTTSQVAFVYKKENFVT